MSTGEGGISSRVATRRRRSSEVDRKTPKKIKINDNSSKSTFDKCENSVGRDTITKNVAPIHGISSDPWIDNSFVRNTSACVLQKSNPLTRNKSRSLQTQKSRLKKSNLATAVEDKASVLAGNKDSNDSKHIISNAETLACTSSAADSFFTSEFNDTRVAVEANITAVTDLTFRDDETRLEVTGVDVSYLAQHDRTGLIAYDGCVDQTFPTVPDVNVTVMAMDGSESNSLFSTEPSQDMNTSTPKLKLSQKCSTRTPFSPSEHDQYIIQSNVLKKETTKLVNKHEQSPQQHQSFNDSDSLFAEMELSPNFKNSFCSINTNSGVCNKRTTPLRMVLDKPVSNRKSANAGLSRKQLYNSGNKTDVVIDDCDHNFDGDDDSIFLKCSDSEMCSVPNLSIKVESCVKNASAGNICKDSVKSLAGGEFSNNSNIDVIDNINSNTDMGFDSDDGILEGIDLKNYGNTPCKNVVQSDNKVKKSENAKSRPLNCKITTKSDVSNKTKPNRNPVKMDYNKAFEAEAVLHGMDIDLDTELEDEMKLLVDLKAVEHENDPALLDFEASLQNKDNNSVKVIPKGNGNNSIMMFKNNSLNASVNLNNVRNVSDNVCKTPGSSINQRSRLRNILNNNNNFTPTSNQPMKLGNVLNQTPNPRFRLGHVLNDRYPGTSPGVQSDNEVIPVTPGSTTGMSLKDRLKMTLQKNAKAATPQNRSVKLKELRLAETKKEVEEMQQKMSEHDIGPFYGLPSKVQQLLQTSRGIPKLYDWQDECLSIPAVINGKNLIYSLPTSGGKTLVAEILILREMLCKKKDAIIVLPFVSIVQEKRSKTIGPYPLFKFYKMVLPAIKEVRGMSTFAVELDFLVEEYAGAKGSFPPKKRRKKQSLYICTIEKANSLVNSFIEEGRIDDVGLVVVDELHMLGEGGSRGAILEMTLTKLKHVAVNTQIVGMSATLNNIQDLLDFMHAELYTNDFRPVELTEFVKLDDTIYQIDPSALCPDDRLKHNRVVLFKYDLDKKRQDPDHLAGLVQEVSAFENCYDLDKKRQDPDHLAGLVQEVIPQHSCLVFCPTKKNCENVAELLCRSMDREITLHKKPQKKALLRALFHDGNGQICPTLKRTVPYGLAYHHSGLTMDERKLIEEAYSEGTLCLLCCTSTLAAGVNLPAKRVILRSPYVGAEFLSRSQYKQMVGRAGRAGIDSSGESILILQKKDKLKLLDLVSGPCDSCNSSLLYLDGKGIRSLLLTTIGLKITESEDTVKQFLQKTLCYVQTKGTDHDITNMAEKGLASLLELGLIANNKVFDADAGYFSQKLEVTKLGRATYKGSVDIDRGPQLLRDLSAAQESLCVANYLHLLYLVTPYDMVDNVQPMWMVYLDEVSCFDHAEQRVASLVGVSESYIAKKASGQRIRKPVDEYPVKRFYLSLVLYNLWKQKSIWEVSAKFKQPRGFIQQLLNGAAAFASCVTHFCQELEEFWAYQDLLTNFVKKLSYCVTLELIGLMEIPGVKIGRARQLFTAGYKTVQQVAYADPNDLVKAIEHLPQRTANQIVASSQMLLQEKADTLRDEAEEMITMPKHMPAEVTSHLTSHVSQENSQSSSQNSVMTTWGDFNSQQSNNSYK